VTGACFTAAGGVPTVALTAVRRLLIVRCRTQGDVIDVYTPEGA
jgi:hypothetical protein